MSTVSHQTNMEEVWMLLLLSFTMLVGCFLAGSIPLAMSLSEDKLRLVSVLGAGLLVGTSLTVIIPEGVNMLYETAEHRNSHSHHDEHKSEAAVAGPELKTETLDHGSHAHVEMHSLIGVALVLGFIFMLLVDQLSGGMHSHSTTDTEAATTSTTTQNRNKMTATLGLVVHAAADGIALGAAATTSQTHVEMIVFIAIMLHKAPAAFGLVSFLLHDGLDRNRIRKHLAAFSAAAPLLAILTYFGLSQQDKEKLTDINATGLAMLFSAGTFLYVSTVHVLPEIAKMGHTHTSGPNGNVIVREQHGFSKIELLALVVGSLLPLVLSLGHHH